MPREIREFFESYRDAFNALDGNAVAEFYAEPSGITQDGVYSHWPQRQPVVENMTALCKLYRDKGFVSADFEPHQFIEQGASYAVADVQWRIVWSSGQEPWRFKTTYNLVRTSQGWKVMLCTAYSEAALASGAGAA
jgi:ketosteroid isomerase-like protein